MIKNLKKQPATDVKKKKSGSSKGKLMTGIIFLILLLVGGTVYFKLRIGSKDEQLSRNEYHAPIVIDEESENKKKELAACPVSDENSIVVREDGTDNFFNADPKGEGATKCKNSIMTIDDLSGLPESKQDEKSGIFNNIEIISKNKDKAIAVSKTLDGNGQIIDAKEFLCDIPTKNCSPTDILQKASRASGRWYEFLKENTSGTETGTFWTAWDSEKNILFGSSGTGVMRNFPILAFNLNTGATSQTIGNERPVPFLPFPENSFSPSLSRFVIVSNSKQSIILYDTANFASPLKKFDISSTNEDYDKFSRSYPIPAVFWSKDEKTLILETRRKIFTLDIESGQLTPRFVSSGDYFDSFLELGKAGWSKNGRYIFFVDHDKGTGSDQAKKQKTYVLKALDLMDMDKPIELFRTANSLTFLER